MTTALTQRASRDSIALSSELREGILQDLVAMGMITTVLRRRLNVEDEDSAARMLSLLSEKLSEDAERLRSVIADLEAA